MNENENLVTEVTENVEQTTEETPAKMFTQDELNEIVGKAKARERAKITKQYERQNADLNELVETLKQGAGGRDARELNEKFTKFYEENNVKIKKKPQYSDRDIEILARAEADEIIRGGYEDVVEEANRLSELGADKMSPKEKAVFKILTDHAKSADKDRQLAEMGVTEDVYHSQDFKDFAGLFNSNTSIKAIYDIYQKTQPKKEIRTAGSMKSSSADNGIKDFYSFEEAKKFTKKDFDDNPALFKAVEKSMAKW